MIGDENTPTEATTTPPSDAQPAAPEAATAEGATAEPEGATQATGGIADALRQAFNDYLEKSGARAQYGNEVNVDLEFLKTHAAPMFSSMFQQLTARIVPKDMKIGVPIQSADPTTHQGPVAVNFDLGGIISSFFSPKKPADTAAKADDTQENKAPTDGESGS